MENDNEYEQLNHLYDECLGYLSKVNEAINEERISEFDILGYTTVTGNDSGKDQLDFRHEIITDVIQEEPSLEIYGDENEDDYDCVVELKDESVVKLTDKLPGNKCDDEYLEKDNDEPLYATVKKGNDEVIIDDPIDGTNNIDPGYETIKSNKRINENKAIDDANIKFNIENEVLGSTVSLPGDIKSERLRRLSQQLPKIIITQSNASLSKPSDDVTINLRNEVPREKVKPTSNRSCRRPPLHRGYAADYPKRLVSKRGMENVALISNVPFERIRLLNDTFHTLINLRWRWIVIGTVVTHFAMWLLFAVFWYMTALAHYDFEPNPPNRPCITGGNDFVTIFLASVEAQTTIGFGDRAIDEECPESIFLFIMQLILGTGLSGVLTCVVYAKITRPEKLSRDGVGFSKKAVISMRDGQLCLMMRAWDLNYDHIISSEFTAHFVNTHKTKEGETIRFFAQSLAIQQRQFLLWPVTLVHVINNTSPLYGLSPEQINSNNYEITLSLKGASASMGTFTQSQTSYLPKELLWGHRFLPVVKYDSRKLKYVIDHSKLNSTEAVDTPLCSASHLDSLLKEKTEPDIRASSPSSFSDRISSFQFEKTSSFKRKTNKL
ncbi:ATP-sensitive inward rectifier potassium channel 11-like [Achroia grisella]|uniref:ATP-sensitive inward rectifier potassium channel 11-like n=1 Tax=Achroia grisella TaxID=688607 RepID=UPI0027D22046|nr:ATP-sensitive inward rectifier potassium channel 11-like [Achroia grisella]